MLQSLEMAVQRRISLLARPISLILSLILSPGKGMPSHPVGSVRSELPPETVDIQGVDRPYRVLATALRARGLASKNRSMLIVFAGERDFSHDIRWSSYFFRGPLSPFPRRYLS